MKKCLAFVLGGGGARGAMQVGALRALFEAGLKPDLLVGTSIGAINATGLALWGVDLAGIDVLERAYQRMQDSKLLDPRLLQFAWNAVSRSENHRGSRSAREFLIAEGILPDLRFGQLKDVRLATVAADLHTGKPVIYGCDPEHSVMEGVLASIAIPPWFAPIERDGQYILDGGALSNLPIEPAIRLGATEIIALDLHDSDAYGDMSKTINPLFTNLISAITQRQLGLEMELAAARRIPVRHVSLRSTPPVPLWDFKTHRGLFKIGYETMKDEMSRWPRKSQPATKLLRLFTNKQPSGTVAESDR
ncbi:MAG: patatin-like phospholipase family protein [Chloroflexi bacterium]|nr:MAG: patatin-like phospholipase family protein [Chloroflexota bacterium]